MKYVVYGMGMLGMVVGFLLLFFAIRTKSIKQEELSVTVSAAMRSSLEKAMEQQLSNEECITHFLKILEDGLNDKGEITVEVYHLNIDKGLFRVSVSLEYEQVNGKNGIIETERTLIYDEVI